MERLIINENFNTYFENMSNKLLIIFLAGALLSGLLPGEARAQSVLRLARVDTVGGGPGNSATTPLLRQIVYSYEVRVDQRAPRPIARLSLDISSPKQSVPPSITGVRGDFSFDALKTRFNIVTVGHPPLFVGTPSGWLGFIDTDGRANWWADQGNEGVKKGVGSGGFILKSPALPAFRKWSVGPDMPLPDADAVGPVPDDPSLVSWSGYVLGPGFMPSEVSTPYFRQQVEIICQLKMSSPKACQDYKTWAFALGQADRAQDDGQYLSILGAIRARIAADKDLFSMAYMVLNKTSASLAGRLPSKRK